MKIEQMNEGQEKCKLKLEYFYTPALPKFILLGFLVSLATAWTPLFAQMIVINDKSVDSGLLSIEELFEAFPKNHSPDVYKYRNILKKRLKRENLGYEVLKKLLDFDNHHTQYLCLQELSKLKDRRKDFIALIDDYVTHEDRQISTLAIRNCFRAYDSAKRENLALIILRGEHQPAVKNEIFNLMRKFRVKSDKLIDEVKKFRDHEVFTLKSGSLETLANLVGSREYFDEISKNLERVRFSQVYRALNMVARIGPPAKSTVPSLVKVLKNENIDLKRYALFALTKIGKDSNDAIPKIMECDTDKRLKDKTIRTIWKINPHHPEFVPFLLRSVEKPWLEKAAIKMLGDLGPRAKASTSVLSKIATSSSKHQKIARDALKKINTH